jgi:hypothetical protein
MIQQINLVVPAEYDQGRIMDGIHHTHIWQILCYGRNQFHLTLESGVGPSNAATIVWHCTERAVVNPKGVGVGHLRSFADTREQCRGAQRAERQEVGVYLVVFVRELDIMVAASLSEESATACVVWKDSPDVVPPLVKSLGRCSFVPSAILVHGLPQRSTLSSNLVIPFFPGIAYELEYRVLRTCQIGEKQTPFDRMVGNSSLLYTSWQRDTLDVRLVQLAHFQRGWIAVSAGSGTACWCCPAYCVGAR